MPTLCRAYTTEEAAHAAVDRLLAAGTTDADVRVVMGRPVRDHRDDAAGGFAGPAAARVGSFAGAPVSSRATMGAFAGGSDQRRGGFGDLDRETVTSHHNGVARIRVASHADVRRMLLEAGLDEAAADADVAALHDGRILVLARTGDVAPDVIARALDGEPSVRPT